MNAQLDRFRGLSRLAEELQQQDGLCLPAIAQNMIATHILCDQIAYMP